MFVEKHKKTDQNRQFDIYALFYVSKIPTKISGTKFEIVLINQKK